MPVSAVLCDDDIMLKHQTRRTWKHLWRNPWRKVATAAALQVRNVMNTLTENAALMGAVKAGPGSRSGRRT